MSRRVRRKVTRKGNNKLDLPSYLEISSENVRLEVRGVVDWTTLPDDSVIQLFSCLNYRDRAALATTCRTWRVLGNSPCLWDTLDLRTHKCDASTATLLANRCSDLRKLRFRGAESADALINLKARGLREINGDYCRKITDATLSIIAARHEVLESLQLGPDFCERISSDAIKAIAVCCPKLQKLRLSGIREVDGDAINALAKNCQNLTDIGFIDCLSVDVKSLGNIVSVRFLSVAGTTNMEWPAAAEHWSKLPKLSGVDVSRTDITPVSVFKLFSSSQSLRVMCALNCPELEDDANFVAHKSNKGKLLLALFTDIFKSVASLFADTTKKERNIFSDWRDSNNKDRSLNEIITWLEWVLSHSLLRIAESNPQGLDNFWLTQGAALLLNLTQSLQEDVQERAAAGLATFVVIDDENASIDGGRAEAVMRDGGISLLLNLARSWREGLQSEATKAIANLSVNANVAKAVAEWICCFILVLNQFSVVSGTAEGDVLYELKINLVDPNNVLQSWDAIADPCTWFHVTCNNEKGVIRVDLGNANLSGQLVSQLGQLSNLQYLELYANNISGRIPDELGNLTNLLNLDLYQNKLNGPIPDTLRKLHNLRFLRLNNNTLTGTIPYSLTTISSLEILDLSHNRLRGLVPVNGSFSLFTPISFAGNNDLVTAPVSPPSLLPPASHQGVNIGTGAIAGGVAVGVVLLFAGSFIVLAWWSKKKRRDQFFNVPAEEDIEVHLGQLKRFPLRELQVATDNFSKKNILGRGGFGKVYKGRLADGTLVAVKRLKEERTQGGELQFQTEIEMISMAVHRNLLQLRGFCMTPTERLLVYPYMSNGSVASCLRERSESQPPLDWTVRQRIALGSARGLAYLHGHCNPKIVHRDVKAANILLDEEFEAVVGDFGLAKLMDNKDTHVTTAVRGTIGHIAPEYLSTGKSSEKTDCFGYGIMLLELITGRRAFDLARLANDDDVMLLGWVKGLLINKKLQMLVDTNLQGNYVAEQVEELLQVALLCTQDSPTERPKMWEVVKMLEGDGLAERWETWQEEMFRQESSNTHNPFTHWTIADSTYNLRADELSAPR